MIASRKVRLFRLLALALLLALVLPYVGAGVARADAGWYNASWQYRKQITINSAYVTADLAYFPVLISLPSDGDLAGNAQSNGDDILFTDADGTTKLSHEIEKFDGNTGQLVAWVRVPNLSSATNTDIYIYYGNGGAGNQQDATNVWDASYVMVQHLEETSGGASAIQDSTSYTNHGTDSNGPTLGATGRINGAATFDGSNDLVDFSNASSLNTTGNMTVEAWIYPTVSNAGKWVVSKMQLGKLQYYLNINGSGNIDFRFTSDGFLWYSATAGVPTLNAWNHVVGVYNKSNVKVYLNTVETTGSAFTGSIQSTTAKVVIGDHYNFDGTYAFTGTIDEVRISSTARSAGWIQTSYNNQSSPATFYTLGSAATQAPNAVGGIVYPVNKLRVLQPWLLLFAFSMLSLATFGGIFSFRKSA